MDKSNPPIKTVTHRSFGFVHHFESLRKRRMNGAARRACRDWKPEIGKSAGVPRTRMRLFEAWGEAG